MGQGLGGQFLGFWEQMKDLGREQRQGVGCRSRVALAAQDAHGMGSATLAPLHPAVLPQHLCNALIQVRNGDGPCTANLRGNPHRLSHRWLLDHAEVALGLRLWGGWVQALGLTQSTSFLPLSKSDRCQEASPQTWEGTTQHMLTP